MEKIRELEVESIENFKIGIPIVWLREYLPTGKGKLELFQEQDRLILTPKQKSRVKVDCK